MDDKMRIAFSLVSIDYLSYNAPTGEVVLVFKEGHGLRKAASGETQNIADIFAFGEERPDALRPAPRLADADLIPPPTLTGDALGGEQRTDAGAVNKGTFHKNDPPAEELLT